MAVRIARGVTSQLTEDAAGGITLQLQQAADAQAAWRGLFAAVAYLREFDADRGAPADPQADEPNTPNYVSEPMPAVAGPFVFIDAKSWPDEALRRLPDLVAEQVEAAGVAEAVIAMPAEGGPVTDAFEENDDEPGLSRAVTAVLLTPVGDLQPGAPRGEIPDGWLDLAWRWLAGHDDASGRVRVAVVDVEFELDLADVPAFLREVRAAATTLTCRLVVGDLQGRIRAVNLRAGAMVPNLVLGAGGPASTDEDLLAAYGDLVAALRQVAGQVGYAFASFDPSFRPLSSSSVHSTEWTTTVGPKPGSNPILLCDEMVVDGFPYQILGPGHIARLGRLWQPSLGRELEDGRVEVTVGEPERWLLPADIHRAGGLSGGLTWHRRDPQAQLAARGLLAPCLLTRDDARFLLHRYWGKF